MNDKFTSIVRTNNVDHHRKRIGLDGITITPTDNSNYTNRSFRHKVSRWLSCPLTTLLSPSTPSVLPIVTTMSFY